MGKQSAALAAIICVGLASVLSAPVHAADGSIPTWVKQLAILWGTDQISDAEFIAALQYLVQVGIITIPEPDSAAEAAQAVAAPEPVQETVPDTAVPSAVHPDAVRGEITRIIDGDTLVFDGDTYRLSLIDTPERGEDGYGEATDALKMLCPVGSTAYMETDSIQGQDRYGRYLGVVWCIGNHYSTTAGEYLHDNGYLKKFYASFCSNTEAATARWAGESGNWFYYDVCN